MKIACLFLSVVGVIVLFSVSHLASQEREEKPPLRNPLPAKEYIEQFQYVQKEMPDESHFSKGRHPDESHRWESIGPSRVQTGSPMLFNEGRVRSFRWYYDSTSSSWIPFLGASSGGLWRGRNLLVLRGWTSLGDNLPNPSVAAFDIDPRDVKTMIVGTGDWARYNGGGVFKTTDEGISWSRAALFSGTDSVFPDHITDLFYDPADLSHIWLSSDQGLFRSDDGGNVFLRRTVDPSNTALPIFDMVMDRLHPDTLFIATGSNLYLGNHQGIWRTTNGGVSWLHLTAGLPTNDSGSTIAIDISRSDPSVLYAAFTDRADNLDAVYRTTNNGANWTATATKPTHMFNGQGGHVNVVKIHPSQPSVVFVGSVSLSKSTNAGAFWNSLDHGHDDIPVIDFDPNNPRYVYLGNDGGIYVRDDSLNIVRNDLEYFAPGSLIQAYSFDYAWSEPSLVLAGTQDNGSILSLSGLGSEVEWKEIYGCDGGYSNSIDPLDSKRMYFNTWCGANTYRLRSLDKGVTIDNITDTLTTPWYPSLSLNKMFTNFVFTYSPWYVYYSSNNGTTWTRTHSGGTDFVSTEAPRGFEINSGVSGDTLIGYTTFWDEGSNKKIKIAGGPLGAMIWRYSQLPDNTMVGRIQVDRWRGQDAYAFSESGMRNVFRTTDGGLHWENINGNLPSVFKHTLVSTPGDPATMFVGTDLGVFRTTNSGAVWHKYQWGLPVVQIVDMAYVPGAGHDTLRIATNGRGFWQRVLDGTDPDFLSIDGSLPLHDLATYGSLGLGLSDSGTTLRTSDGGTTWTIVPTALPVDQGIVFSTASSLFAVGKAGKMFRSIDGGFNWAPQNTPTQADLFSLHFIDSTTGFAAGDQGILLRTSDKGASWTNTTNQIDGAIYNVDFSDDKNGFAVGMTLDANQNKHRLLLLTTNGGNAWSPSQAISGDGALNAVACKGTHILLAGDAGYAARSTDGGQSWTPLQFPGKPTTDFRALAGIAIPPFAGVVTPSDYVGGADGSIFASEDHGVTWATLESGAIGPIQAFAYMSGAIGPIMAGARRTNSSDSTHARIFFAGSFGLSYREESDMSEVALSYKTGWNLLSVPVNTDDYRKSTLYPAASTRAFYYANQYVARDTTVPGQGFWLKFPFDGNQGFIGSSIETLNVPLSKGWNIVGAPDQPVPSSSVTTSPPGILTSFFYGYKNSYFTAESLKPGFGYWVKSSSVGTLGITHGVPKAGRRRDGNAGRGSLTFVDRLGRSATLYFSCYPEADLSGYELPPLPPEGAFDVRFGSGRAMESPLESTERTVPVDMTSAEYPVTCTWEYPDEGAGIWLVSANGELRLRSAGSYVLEESGRLLVRFGKGEALPTSFRLHQNYPNPFNPVTRIRYELPRESNVSLKVYDVLGRLVATLVDAVESPGVKLIDWEAGGFASGVYFCRLEAASGKETFTHVQKMLLMR